MGVLGSMVANAGRTTRNIAFVLAMLISLAVNLASFTVNVVSTAVSALIEAVTGVETVVSTARKATQSATKLEQDLARKAAEVEVERAAKLTAETELASTRKLASKWQGTAAGRKLLLEQVEAEKAVVEADLAASRKVASWGKGTVAGLELKLERTEAAQIAAELEATELRVARRVTYQGVEMAVPEAVSKAASKIKARTVKLAFADLSATGAQALPWIGAAAVVAATGYDLKMSCDTMRDMREIEVAVNPEAAEDLDVDRICGLKVPTEAEIWEAIKASPKAEWDQAKEVLNNLSMPTVPDFEWPSLPEIGLPDVPDINLKFWE